MNLFIGLWHHIISGYNAIDEILDQGNTSGFIGKNNNDDSKNLYAKADFSTYNLKGANLSWGKDVTSIAPKKFGNNINNISVGQSNK